MSPGGLLRKAGMAVLTDDGTVWPEDQPAAVSADEPSG
jgi:hypothetical protein